MASFHLADLFELVVDAVPERTALVCGNTKRTYKELDQRATMLANSMKEKGILAGDHVGIYLYNSAEYIEASLACYKIRAVPINVNYRYVEDELLYLFDNADLKALVYGKEFTSRVNNVASQLPQLNLYIAVEDSSGEEISKLNAFEYETLLNAGSKDRNFEERSGQDLYILYTGGTTGMPKGVMWPHENLFFRSLGGGGLTSGGEPIKTPEEIAERAVNGMEMATMPTAPLMHGACQWSCLIALFGGQKVVITSTKSFDPEHVWNLVEQEKVNTVTFVGDAMGRPLLDCLNENPNRWDLSSMFALGSGGAVFSDTVQQGFKQHFPNVFLINSFGSSETGFQGSSDDSKDGGLGNIKLADHNAVIDENHEFCKPGDGKKGILSLRGHTPIGYYKDEKKTAETFVKINDETWVLSGDIASIEEDGTIVVYGRGSVCINSGGEKIYPEEVESALKEHPAIFDTLVVGLPDERFGNRVAAVVQLRKEQTLSLESMMDHCRTKVSGYKVPRDLFIAGEIKRHPSGKPDYKWAKGHAESGAGKVTPAV